MSVHVMSWVLRNSEATLGQRLVLLVIADHANHDGSKSWCSVATIAHEARLSRAQVQRCLRALESAGAIVETGKGPKGTHEYSVAMGPQIEARGASSTTTGGASSSANRGPHPEAQTVHSATVQEQPSKDLATVNRKRVTDDERSLAEAVLETWNVQAHQRLTNVDWLRKIILRIREHPNLTIAEHDDVIRYALNHPWWKGDPGPSVVYGNGALFEQHLMQAAKGDKSGSQGAFDVALAALRDRRQT